MKCLGRKGIPLTLEVREIPRKLGKIYYPDVYRRGILYRAIENQEKGDVDGGGSSWVGVGIKVSRKDDEENNEIRQKRVDNGTACQETTHWYGTKWVDGWVKRGTGSNTEAVSAVVAKAAAPNGAGCIEFLLRSWNPVSENTRQQTLNELQDLIARMQTWNRTWSIGQSLVRQNYKIEAFVMNISSGEDVWFSQTRKRSEVVYGLV
ncbi:hypothetical protein M0804_009188 [Polistes exclamans]|nr:hypothetical protein M0804_009188 [Polistes exclamans]